MATQLGSACWEAAVQNREAQLSRAVAMAGSGPGCSKAGAGAGWSASLLTQTVALVLPTQQQGREGGRLRRSRSLETQLSELGKLVTGWEAGEEAGRGAGQTRRGRWAGQQQVQVVPRWIQPDRWGNY